MRPNDSHKLRGLTHSFALKHSPKFATARRRRAFGNPRGASRTVSLMLGWAALRNSNFTANSGISSAMIVSDLRSFSRHSSGWCEPRPPAAAGETCLNHQHHCRQSTTPKSAREGVGSTQGWSAIQRMALLRTVLKWQRGVRPPCRPKSGTLPGQRLGLESRGRPPQYELSDQDRHVDEYAKHPFVTQSLHLSVPQKDQHYCEKCSRTHNR